MLKITDILKFDHFTVTCRFNTGEIKALNLHSVLINQIHLKGVSRLLNEERLHQAKVGSMGELVWPSVVGSDNDDAASWDYDISPEYFYHHAESI